MAILASKSVRLSAVFFRSAYLLSLSWISSLLFCPFVSLQGYVPVSAGSDQGASFRSANDNIMVLILFSSDIIKKP
jgi:hypothetical protein